MAKSFKCSDDTANEVVQEMYIRLSKYVDEPERIMFNEHEINTYYVYVTMRNIYLTSLQRKNRTVQYIEIKDNRDYEEADIEREKALQKVVDNIKKRVDTWYWYDKKLWEIHFERQMSMRAIASATTISLSSIFNTLKSNKNKIREEFGEDIEDLNNKDYDRI
jgi:DNA-directed RNA polymerase specialized sigma24 family protein